MKQTIRADKLLSSLGLASRRGVVDFIKYNNISADGVRINEHGDRVSVRSVITVNGKELKKPKKVYVIINKPKGIISTLKDEKGRRTVVSLIKMPERLYPVGRLDQNTHGLLLLTNDGELTNKLIHPRYHIGKTYQLIIKGQIFQPQIAKLENGVMLEDGMTGKASCSIIQRKKDSTIMELTIYEGKKRQIRRMCEAINLPLLDLQRIKFGNINLGDLKIGDYRELTGREVEDLQKLLSTSK